MWKSEIVLGILISGRCGRDATVGCKIVCFLPHDSLILYSPNAMYRVALDTFTSTFGHFHCFYASSYYIVHQCVFATNIRRFLAVSWTSPHISIHKNAKARSASHHADQEVAQNVQKQQPSFLRDATWDVLWFATNTRLPARKFLFPFLLHDANSQMEIWFH